MKTYTAEEGKVFKNGEEILGNILYTPDDFDDSNLIQIDKPEEEEEWKLEDVPVRWRAEVESLLEEADEDMV